MAPRIILHLDMDAFYATVLENENPALRQLPFGVQQKGLLATCNYVARARGVGKLQPISEARKACKDLVVVNGEDLTRFRNVSKTIWLFVRDATWGALVERLGLDEIWVDATEMVDFNLELSQKRRGELFFRLSRSDPALGFPYSWDALPGCVYPEQQGGFAPRNPDVLTQRLHLGAQLTHYLRKQILERFHHPTHAGISTSKVASKLVGNLQKPANQTLLLPRSYAAFLGQHELAEIPGIGSKTALKLRAAVHKILDPATPETEPVTVEIALPILTPAVIAAAVQTTFSSATHIHNLLCGADTNPITLAPLYPTQISIEDTFRPGNYCTVASITPVLTALLAKLLTRIQSDLQSPDGSWLAHPRTLRISTRLHDGFSARTSRSTAFPSSILTTPSGDRLTETALPVLKRLLPPPPASWSLQLLNIAATNMVPTSHPGAADIRAFLRTGGVPSHTPDDGAELSDSFSGSSDSEDEPAFTACSDCGTKVPDFALTAHAIFHENNSQHLNPICARLNLKKEMEMP